MLNVNAILTKIAFKNALYFGYFVNYTLNINYRINYLIIYLLNMLIFLHFLISLRCYHENSIQTIFQRHKIRSFSWLNLSSFFYKC